MTECPKCGVVFAEVLCEHCLAATADGPEGPYVHGEIVEGRMCFVWHEDECSRDSVFMGSGEQVIAVCDVLNRLKGETDG